MDEETVLAEVMTEVAIAELSDEEVPSAIIEGLKARGYGIREVAGECGHPIDRIDRDATCLDCGAAL